MTQADAIRENTEALQSVENRLRVVQDILDELRSEVQWLANNLGDHQPEHVRCMECERTIRGLAEALRRGWNELMLYEGQYMGMCDACLQEYDERAEASVRPTTPEDLVPDPPVNEALLDACKAAPAVEEQIQPNDTTVGRHEPLIDQLHGATATVEDGGEKQRQTELF